MTDRAAVAGTRAGIVTRLAAFIVDAVVVTIISRGAVWVLSATARALRQFAPPIDLAQLLVAFVPLVIVIYCVGFWWLIGQTPGKWLLGIKVVAVGGGRLTLGRALLRQIGYVISAVPCYLGFLWILGPERRGWHDRLAGTEVVYVARRHEPAAPGGHPLGGFGHPATV
jgi:uncharacterized RDD family membrane protein YckC